MNELRYYSRISGDDVRLVNKILDFTKSKSESKRDKSRTRTAAQYLVTTNDMNQLHAQRITTDKLPLAFKWVDNAANLNFEGTEALKLAKIILGTDITNAMKNVVNLLKKGGIGGYSNRYHIRYSVILEYHAYHNRKASIGWHQDSIGDTLWFGLAYPELSLMPLITLAPPDLVQTRQLYVPPLRDYAISLHKKACDFESSAPANSQLMGRKSSRERIITLNPLQLRGGYVLALCDHVYYHTSPTIWSMWEYKKKDLLALLKNMNKILPINQEYLIWYGLSLTFDFKKCLNVLYDTIKQSDNILSTLKMDNKSSFLKVWYLPTLLANKMGGHAAIVDDCLRLFHLIFNGKFYNKNEIEKRMRANISSYASGKDTIGNDAYNSYSLYMPKGRDESPFMLTPFLQDAKILLRTPDYYKERSFVRLWVRVVPTVLTGSTEPSTTTMSMIHQIWNERNTALKDLSKKIGLKPET